MNSTASGTKILILGILSIVCLPILGPIAWVMGNKALAAIDSGQGDSSQRGSIAAGRICGIVGTVLLILAVVYLVAVLVFGFKLVKSAQPATNNYPAGINLPAGTVIHSTTNANESPRQVLSDAIMSDDVHRVKALLDRDPSLVNKGNAIGETPLFDAAFFGKLDIATALIDRGADVNAADKFGATALDKAMFFKNNDIVALLKSHGARRGKPQ